MDWLQYIFGPLLFMTSAFLIMIVLLQRGKGGGLVGALGGSGGQSAFGTKFGDRLMWVTYGVAVFWILLILASILLLSKTNDPFANDGKSPKRTSGGEVSADPSAEDKSKETDSNVMGSTDAESKETGSSESAAKEEDQKDKTSRFTEGAKSTEGKPVDEKPEAKPEENKTEEKKEEPAKPADPPAGENTPEGTPPGSDAPAKAGEEPKKGAEPTEPKL